MNSKNGVSNDLDPFYLVNSNNRIDNLSIELKLVENIDANKKYNLSFCKNNEIIGGNINKKEINNGNISVDLDKYYCYYALSSIRCHCQNKKDANKSGFEFEISNAT